MYRTRGFSAVEFTVMLSVFAVSAGLSLPAVRLAKESAHRASCMDDLKQIGMTFKMYSGESKGERYPTMMLQASGSLSEPDALENHVLFGAIPFQVFFNPEYFSDPGLVFDFDDEKTRSILSQNSILDVLADPKYLDNVQLKFVYFGWFFDKADDNDGFYPNGPTVASTNFSILAQEGDSRSLGKGMPRQLVHSFGNVATETRNMALAKKSNEIQQIADQNIAVGKGIGNINTMTIWRLFEGMYRFLIDDINSSVSEKILQSNIVVLTPNIASKKIFSEIPAGGWVLYMDGHVDFSRVDDSSFLFSNPINMNMATFHKQFRTFFKSILNQ